MRTENDHVKELLVSARIFPASYYILRGATGASAAGSAAPGTPDLPFNWSLRLILRHTYGMKRIIQPAMLALLLLSTGVLAACGGNSLASDPAKVVAEAKLPPAGPNASQIKVEFTPQSDGGAQGSTGDGGLGALLSGPITIEATTEGDAATGVSGDAKVTAGPLDLSAQLRADKSNAWLQVGGQWYELGSPLGIDFGGIGSSLGPLGTLVKEPKATAVEDVDGVQCDRITGTVDLASLSGALGGLAEGLPIDLSGLKVDQGEISLWVARDSHVVRRIQLKAAGAGGSGDSAVSGGLTVDLTVVPAEAVTVSAPTGVKPISDLLTSLLGGQGGLGGLGDLGGLLGGLGGLGGTQTGAGA